MLRLQGLDLSVAFYLVQFSTFMLGEWRRKNKIECCQGRKCCWASIGTNKGQSIKGETITLVLELVFHRAQKVKD